MTEHYERRTDKIRFDWSLNVGNIVAILMLLATFIRFGTEAVGYLQNVNSKVNIMWVQFAKDHPEVAMQNGFIKSD